jgi:hypothetical protein
MLQNEGVLFYYRYLLLFQSNDFERTARDTEHNLRLCRLLERYCPDEDDRNAVLQFKPYILRMNAMARAMTAVKQGMGAVARQILEGGIAEIDGLEDIDSPAFRFEKVRSANYLRSTLSRLADGELDVDGDSTGGGEEEWGEVTALEQELEQAVEEENYERAATLRDRIRELSS